MKTININTHCPPANMIGSGNQNQTSGNHSAIGGGELNNIGTYGLAGGHCSFIGGGQLNVIELDGNTISGGRRNYICGNDSAISGGHNNHIGDITLTLSANCSFIGGGLNNRVTGDFSAILGGNGNNDNGLAFAGIYGNGITAVAPDTFHVSCLNAVNTPLAFAAPTGTIMYKTFATLLPTDRILVIAP